MFCLDSQARSGLIEQTNIFSLRRMVTRVRCKLEISCACIYDVEKIIQKHISKLAPSLNRDDIRSMPDAASQKSRRSSENWHPVITKVPFLAKVLGKKMRKASLLVPRSASCWYGWARTVVLRSTHGRKARWCPAPGAGRWFDVGHEPERGSWGLCHNEQTIERDWTTLEQSAVNACHVTTRETIWSCIGFTSSSSMASDCDNDTKRLPQSSKDFSLLHVIVVEALNLLIPVTSPITELCHRRTAFCSSDWKKLLALVASGHF